MKPRLIFICGSGHSGSTLLDMMLGGHAKVSSLGEVALSWIYANHHTPADRCTCGLHVSACPFWVAVDAALAPVMGLPEGEALKQLEVVDPRTANLRDEEGHFIKLKPGEKYPYRSRLNEAVLVLGHPVLRDLLGLVSPMVRLHKKISFNRHLLYEAVRTAHDTPVILDSTKNPGYLKGLYLTRTEDMRFIHLIRDGRSVCASRMRRESVSMAEALPFWLSEQRKLKFTLKTIDPAQVKRFHYEDLCRDTPGTLQALCDWVGLPYDEQEHARMLDFRSDRHNLGGNPMRRRSEETEIRLDERWKTELNENDLAEFDARGGAVNRDYGYAS